MNEKVWEYCEDSKFSIEYLNDTIEIYKIIKEYHPGKKTRKTLIVYNDIISNMLSILSFRNNLLERI